MFKKILMAIGIFSVMSGNANADQHAYGGINVTPLKYSEEYFDATLVSLIGIAGYEFNRYFSGEMRFGIGLKGEDYDGGSLDLNKLIGGYIKAGMPVNDSFVPYVIVGSTNIELEAGGESASESDTSFGLGFDFGLNEKTFFAIEYMNYFDKNGAEINGFSLGIKSKF